MEAGLEAELNGQIQVHYFQITPYILQFVSNKPKIGDMKIYRVLLLIATVSHFVTAKPQWKVSPVSAWAGPKIAHNGIDFIRTVDPKLDATPVMKAKENRVFHNVGGGALFGAGAGATIGSFIAPGPGTAIGGALGGAVGSIGGAIKEAVQQIHE